MPTIILSPREVRSALAGELGMLFRPINVPRDEFGDFEYATLRGPEIYEPTIFGRDGEDHPGKPVFGVYSEDGEWGTACPYGKPGDELVCKETWRFYGRDRGDGPEGGFEYRADLTSRDFTDFAKPNSAFTAFVAEWDFGRVNKWRSSQNLPQWASRITLPLLDVQVVRVQDVTEADAIACGIELLESRDHEGRVKFDRSLCGECGGLRLHNGGGPSPDADCTDCDTMRKRFRWDWDARHSKQHPYSANPFAWRLAVGKGGA